VCAIDLSATSADHLSFYAENLINDDQYNLLLILLYCTECIIFPNLIPIAIIIISQCFAHLNSLKQYDAYLISLLSILSGSRGFF